MLLYILVAFSLVMPIYILCLGLWLKRMDAHWERLRRCRRYVWQTYGLDLTRVLDPCFDEFVRDYRAPRGFAPWHWVMTWRKDYVHRGFRRFEEECDGRR
jgi:hypothetical protein